MINKLKLTLFGVILTVGCQYNCKAQNTQDKKDTNNIEMEQKVIHLPQENPKGFFTGKTQSIDRVEISYYKLMVDKKPQIKKTVKESSIINELIQPLLGLPVNGDIFKKLAPRSSFYWVQFFSGQTKVGEAKIYNNSLQMSNTAFLSEANELEDSFVNKVRQIINL